MFLQQLDQLKGQLSTKYAPLMEILRGFYERYCAVTASVIAEQKQDEIFAQYLKLLRRQIEQPYVFELYHQAITEPENYTKFGCDFTRPLIDFAHSSCTGKEQLGQIEKWLLAKENVILLANHQVELDPQVLMLMLQDEYPEMIKRMVCVAGQKVLTNPLAVPFSLGCNLLCIFSRKYIDQDPSTRMDKQLHNQRTMKTMRHLLSQGGCCIYVAPSGGRDRMDENGTIKLAPFDPDSIEMLRLMAAGATSPTHFCPLALHTMPLLAPPPVGSLEETLLPLRAPVHLHFCPEIALKASHSEDKHAARIEVAAAVFEKVEAAYRAF